MTRMLTVINTTDADVLQQIVDNPSLLDSSSFRANISKTMEQLRVSLAVAPYEETQAMDDGQCFCAWDEAGSPGTLGNFISIVRAMESRFLKPNREERKIRRMLCLAYSGSKAYMDDGEASDSSVMPAIDFLRMDADTIEGLMRQRGLNKVAAMPRADLDKLLKDSEAPSPYTEVREEVWTRKNGTHIPVGDMHEQHAKNALRLILRNARRQKETPQWLKDAYAEAQSQEG